MPSVEVQGSEEATDKDDPEQRERYQQIPEFKVVVDNHHCLQILRSAPLAP
jgi:hypothetical protein